MERVWRIIYTLGGEKKPAGMDTMSSISPKNIKMTFGQCGKGNALPCPPKSSALMKTWGRTPLTRAGHGVARHG